MIKFLFLFIESYLITLVLQLAHGNSLESVHTLLISVLGALIFLLIGAGVALIALILGKYFQWKANVPYIASIMCIAVVGIALIAGAQPGLY